MCACTHVLVGHGYLVTCPAYVVLVFVCCERVCVCVSDCLHVCRWPHVPEGYGQLVASPACVWVSAFVLVCVCVCMCVCVCDIERGMQTACVCVCVCVCVRACVDVVTRVQWDMVACCLSRLRVCLCVNVIVSVRVFVSRVHIKQFQALKIVTESSTCSDGSIGTGQ